MKEQNLPSEYHFAERKLTFGQIHSEFSSTKYGDILKNNVRFGSFKPDSMFNTEWRKLLGADVNNLEHMSLSLGLTREFLRHCANPPERWRGKISDEAKFTRDEQAVLLLTAVVHDQAEAVIGDIPLPEKTKKDEEREMRIFKKIFSEVLGRGDDSKVYDAVSEKVIDVLSDPKSKLGRAFNAIEHIGYTRTALRAWDRSKEAEGDIKISLENMAYVVVPHGFKRLTAYSEIYPPVDLFLMHNKKNIDQILERGGNMPYPVKDKVVWEADSNLSK